MLALHYEKNKVFCNKACNWVFELQQPFVTKHIFTTWILLDELQELQLTQLIIYEIV
jgi:hypothetical protein